jgi:DNA-binding transcriptional MerR regulator
MSAARRYMTTAELALALSINAGTIQRWRRLGLIRPELVTPGGQARWDEASVRDQLRALDEQRRAELEKQEQDEIDRARDEKPRGD